MPQFTRETLKYIGVILCEGTMITNTTLLKDIFREAFRAVVFPGKHCTYSSKVYSNMNLTLFDAVYSLGHGH